MNKSQKTTIKIPTLLKKETEHYLKKNKSFLNFEEFVTFHLRNGLQNEILRSMSQLERSYRCRDFNPKIVKRTYETMGEKQEYFLCDECKENPVFGKYESEEKIKWGD